MSMKKTWLLKLSEIREELMTVEAPVIDRATFEDIFGVRRRRALQLMHECGGWQAGQSFLVDRAALLRRIEQFQESPDALMERKRRRRINDALDEARRCRTARQIGLPVSPDADQHTVVHLPDGIHLQPGRLVVEFGQPEELLARLYELAQVAARDFEGFRQVAAGQMRHLTAHQATETISSR